MMRIRLAELRAVVREALAGEVSGDEMQLFIDNPQRSRSIGDDPRNGRNLRALEQALRAQFGDRRLSAEAEGTLHGAWPKLMRARHLQRT